jgi:hypothetical protein
MNALSEVSQIKVAAPNMAQQVIDFAMQIHGGGGMSDDFPLAMAWTGARPCARRRARRGAPRHGRPARAGKYEREPVSGEGPGHRRRVRPRRRARRRVPARGDDVLVTDLTEPTTTARSTSASTSPATTTGPRPCLGRGELGRPRRPGQQRRHRHGRPASTWCHPGRVAVDHRHQPARRGPRLPHVRADDQGAAERPHRQHRLPRRARAPAGHGVVHAVKAGVVALSETLSYELQPVGHRRVGRVPRLLPDAAGVSRSPAATRRWTVAARLIEKSPSPPAGRGRGDEGHRRPRMVILPDAPARKAVWTKRFARPLYDREQRSSAPGSSHHRPEGCFGMSKGTISSPAPAPGSARRWPASSPPWATTSRSVRAAYRTARGRRRRDQPPPTRTAGWSSRRST